MTAVSWNAIVTAMSHHISQLDTRSLEATLPIADWTVGSLKVQVYPDKQKAGAIGALLAAEEIRRLVHNNGQASVIFASAVSQDPFLASLRLHTDVDWSLVTAFHMDEYAHMSGDHPASFRRFLRERLLDHLPLRGFHQLKGEAADLEAECVRYAALLNAARPGLVILGIGENGHLAFIDPQVCNFKEPRTVRLVGLDDVCRMQQVHDGQFQGLDEVPDTALSLTIPLFLSIPRALVFVNGQHKSDAVRATLQGPISESCPASILRLHPNATLLLDPDAACKLER